MGDTANAGYSLTILFAVLSILGAIGLVISYVRCSNESSTLRQLLLGMTIADGLLALSNLGGAINFHRSFTADSNRNNFSEGCVIQSFVSTSANLATCFYDMAILIYYYVAMAINNEGRLRRNIVWIHLIIWLFPIAIVSIALNCGALGVNLSLRYGVTGPWCWISDTAISHNSQILWMSLTTQGWAILAYIIGPTFTILLLYESRRHVPIGERRGGPLWWANITPKNANLDRFVTRTDDSKFFYTPLVFYLLRIWGTIRFLIASIEMSKPIHVYMPMPLVNFLYVMQCIGDNSHGFYNFVIYCAADAKVRRSIWRKASVSELSPLTESMENSAAE